MEKTGAVGSVISPGVEESGISPGVEGLVTDDEPKENDSDCRIFPEENETGYSCESENEIVA